MDCCDPSLGNQTPWHSSSDIAVLVFHASSHCSVCDEVEERRASEIAVGEGSVAEDAAHIAAAVAAYYVVGREEMAAAGLVATCELGRSHGSASVHGQHLGAYPQAAYLEPFPGAAYPCWAADGAFGPAARECAAGP